MPSPVPRNYPDLEPFLPKGWTVVREKGGITTIDYFEDLEASK